MRSGLTISRLRQRVHDRRIDSAHALAVHRGKLDRQRLRIWRNVVGFHTGRSGRNRYRNLDVDESCRRPSGIPRRTDIRAIGVFGEPPQAEVNPIATNAAIETAACICRAVCITDRAQELIGGADVGLTVGAFDQRQLRKVVGIRCLVGRVIGRCGIDVVAFAVADRRSFLPDWVSGPRLSASASFCRPALCVTSV